MHCGEKPTSVMVQRRAARSLHTFACADFEVNRWSENALRQEFNIRHGATRSPGAATLATSLHTFVCADFEVNDKAELELLRMFNSDQSAGNALGRGDQFADPLAGRGQCTWLRRVV